MADTRKDDTDFYYWLNIIELLSGNSPVLIIKNEKDDRPREINERQLRSQFTNLKEVLQSNFATNRGLDNVLAKIQQYISQLPHVGDELPKTWLRVRRELENNSYNFISLDEYLDICERNGFKKHKDKLQLSAYLHELGICLHYQDDPLLSKTVILKPDWCTDAVYKVLDTKRVIENLGKFNRADLEEIWVAEEYAQMRDELLQMMIKFQLCYQIPSSIDTYIVPQLLTENQPDYEWIPTNNLLLRYSYDFMPKGILWQFIVIMHAFIAEQNLVWRSGVVLERDKTLAEVIENRGKREIKIRIAGKYKKDLLTIITYELDKIHKTYQHLEYQTLIPCNCPNCKYSQTPTFYPFEILRKFAADGQPIQCHQSYGMVDVLALIDDVLDRSQLLSAENDFVDEIAHRDHLRKLIRLKMERLQVLEEKKAQYGLNVSAEIETEIRNIQAEIEELQSELNELNI